MDEPPIELTDSQRDSLRATFKYLDRLMGDALAEIALAANGALFHATRPDADSRQRQAAAESAERLRCEMARALGLCGIADRDPDVGAVSYVRGYLTFMNVVLEELSPERLRGFGPVSESTERRVRALQARLRGVVAELVARLQ